MRQNISGVVGEIDTLPGCSQVCVSHSVFLPPHHRGDGLGTEANKSRQQIAFEQLNYDMMLCTVDADNKVQKAILKHNGWKYLEFFKSRKTGHMVELWSCLYDRVVANSPKI